jgi:hypothetical protein
LPQPPAPRAVSVGARHNKKAPVHEFLPDSRVEVIWDRLHKELKLPDDVGLATEVQAKQWVEGKDGIALLQPERVVFWAVCPNPQPRWQEKLLKHFATIDMEEWQQAEMTKWRFAGSPDPAYVIFRALCKKLIKDYENWRTLN